jgi:hypothetical protein
VGYGKWVRIGEDPWVSSREGYNLLEDPVNDLHDYGIYSLKDTSIGDSDHIGRSNWKLASILESVGEKVDLWEGYLNLLRSNFIFLQEEEEDTLLLSGNEKNGSYSAKLGYNVLVEEYFNDEKKLWWNFIWAPKTPNKSKIILWSAMENKMLAWDNGLK